MQLDFSLFNEKVIKCWRISRRASNGDWLRTMQADTYLSLIYMRLTIMFSAKKIFKVFIVAFLIGLIAMGLLAIGISQFRFVVIASVVVGFFAIVFAFVCLLAGKLENDLQ